MVIGGDGAVLRQLRTLLNVGAVRELTDGQLLERFATGRGEAAELAFAVLVERHGPMVLRVCRGVLADPHDTQDAFQATFLVLVRKARALWVRDSLGPWLHQVAYRTASCARSAAARRRRHERSAAASREEGRSEVGDELGRVLHEEIDRLPDRFRTPVILCDLGGRTHEQAARHLGWPIGTVKSRLSRGRDRLRDRLRRRGLDPTAGLLAAAPGPSGPDASIPPALVDSTTGAAVRSLTVKTAVGGSAASLAQGVLRSMTMTRWLKVASALLVLGATASGVRSLAQKGAPGDGPRPEGDPRAVRADDMPVFEVKPGKLDVTVVERGVVAAAHEGYVTCPVEGSTTILSILPEGTIVKKGQLVAELDSSALKDQLAKQEIVESKAETIYQNFKHLREADEKDQKAGIEQKRSVELASKTAWEAEREKGAKIRKQIEGCKLLAPADGMVIHANAPPRFGGRNHPQIEKGAAVRERQIIFKIPDLSQFVAIIMVHEPVIDRIKPGQRARIWIDAFPEQTRSGAVDRVAPLPDPNTITMRDIRVYSTRITIEGGPDGLRPGMAAQAEFFVDSRDDALGVPVRAVYHRDGKDLVTVKRPDGGFDWREVTLGLFSFNDGLVEVKRGLKAGEVVALRPLAAMRESEKRQEPSPPTQPATRPNPPR